MAISQEWEFFKIRLPRIQHTDTVRKTISVLTQLAEKRALSALASSAFLCETTRRGLRAGSLGLRFFLTIQADLVAFPTLVGSMVDVVLNTRTSINRTL